MTYIHNKMALSQWLLMGLLLFLPVLVWALNSTNFDIRNRAATTANICWNTVRQVGETYTWPDACRGRPGGVCAQVITPLTAGEITGYTDWANQGRPGIAGCTGITDPIIPETPTVNDITRLMGKLCSELTEEEKQFADTDHSGCINTLDLLQVMNDAPPTAQ